MTSIFRWMTMLIVVWISAGRGGAIAAMDLETVVPHMFAQVEGPSGNSTFTAHR